METLCGFYMQDKISQIKHTHIKSISSDIFQNSILLKPKN